MKSSTCLEYKVGRETSVWTEHSLWPHGPTFCIHSVQYQPPAARENLNLNELILNKMKIAVSQSHWSHLKCSEPACGYHIGQQRHRTLPSSITQSSAAQDWLKRYLLPCLHWLNIKMKLNVFLSSKGMLNVYHLPPGKYHVNSLSVRKYLLLLKTENHLLGWLIQPKNHLKCCYQGFKKFTTFRKWVFHHQ